MSSGRPADDACSGLVCYGALSDRSALLGVDAKRCRPSGGGPQTPGTDHTPMCTGAAAPALFSDGVAGVYRHGSFAVYSTELCRIRGGKTAPEENTGPMRGDQGVNMSELLKLDA